MKQAGSRQVVTLQVIVPDYRAPFFQALSERLGHDVIVFAGDDDFSEALRPSENTSEVVHRAHNYFFGGRRFLWQTGHWSRSLHSTVLIANYNPRILSTLVILVIRALAGRPTILWGHARGRRRWLVPLVSQVVRLSSGFIAYTEQQRKDLAARYPRRPFWAAHNGIMFKGDCRPSDVDCESLNDIIYVGRMVARKKPMLLLDGFRIAVDRGLVPAVARLVLVGDGPLLEDLRRSIPVRLAERVRLLGHIVALESLRALYATALCSVSPGCVGLSCIQSFAFGVPMAIASDEPHGPEIEACSEGDNCSFFAKDDAGALAEAMGVFFRDRDSWAERRDGIASGLRRTYTFEAMIDTFENAITAVSQAKVR